MLGQLDVAGSAGVHEIVLRRYRCLGCGAVLTVGPWDLLPGMLYSLLTVVVALARWATGHTKASVRAQHGAFTVVGVTERQSWPSLRRWGHWATAGRLLGAVSVSVSGTLRERVRRWVHILAGAGPPDESLPLRALVGARHYR